MRVVVTLMPDFPDECPFCVTNAPEPMCAFLCIESTFGTTPVSYSHTCALHEKGRCPFLTTVDVAQVLGKEGKYPHRRLK